MNNKLALPLIPLRGMIVFPNMTTHFDVGREKSKKAIEAALNKNDKIFLSSQIDSNIENPKEDEINIVGTVCTIKQVIKMPDNLIRVLVEGEFKGKIKKFIENEDKYYEVIISEVKDKVKDETVETACLNILKDAFKEFLKIAGEKDKEVLLGVDLEDNLGDFSDRVAAAVANKEEDKQYLLETLDLKKRTDKLLELIKFESDVMRLQLRISRKVKANLDKGQKEYFLREQLRVINEELGEDEESEFIEYETRVKEAKLPKDIREKALNELNRLRGQSYSSSEGNTIRNYLNWILDLPWGKYKKDTIDLIKVEEVLNKEHYGMDDVKERILEYLTVSKLSKNIKSNILCLVGPPGVGKTSIALSISNALNRDYSRISLGGMKDEAEIRGHRRTYVGATPGRFVHALKDAKSMNPVILLDEIDKISSSYKGEPSDALLEVLDSEQNSTFRDNYLEVPLDLSKAMFITTANNLSDIPEPLLDRMDIIELSGYTYEEKFNIAKNHLIKKIYDEFNLDYSKISISDEALKNLIDGYTKESGVRGLNRKIKELIRKALRFLEKEGLKSLIIDEEYLEKILGKKVYSYETTNQDDLVGVVMGLAWTAYGGDTLPIEAIAMEGSGKLQLTGKLGEVMQESAKAAYTFVRANAKRFGIKEDYYKNTDIHVHVPEGAVPKDGPSAGITMVTALVSALSNKKVKSSVAMTGEVTITGRVLAIGGLKEKSLAAYRAGVKTIIIPNDNEKDLDDIPSSIKDKINIVSVKHVDEVLKIAIVGECSYDN